ncbi:MAG: DUF1566 domain-containing protein, partial [Prevotellaceae bacterium]|nr:DUF1566 domain-containing protein [Prevotellaceae bacterium]
VIAGSLNGRGFYLRGTTPTFSSAVTVALAGLNAGDRFNWCAYASDYPPNATEGAGFYELHGTPSFLINGTITEPSRQYAGCITSLTDRTGCPGLVPVSPAISSFIASPDTICVGDTVTLTAATNIAGAASYSFNNGAWITDNAATFTPSTTTDYTLHIRNIAGCTATTVPVPVVVHPLPVPAFVSPPSTACAGSTVTLTATGGGSYCFTYGCSFCGHNPYVTGNDTPTEYDCVIRNDSCTYNANNTYAVTMPDTGSITVWVKVINDNGCINSASTTIEVRTAPTVSLLSDKPVQTVTTEEAIADITYATANAFGATVAGLPAGVSGTWSANTCTISGTPTETGTFNYTVIATNSNSCTDSSATGTITVNGAFTSCGGFSWVSVVAYENHTSVDWLAATAYCASKGSGWRLPTIDELTCLRNNEYPFVSTHEVTMWSSVFVYDMDGSTSFDWNTGGSNVDWPGINYPFLCVK